MHHDIYVVIINYSLCIIYDICAVIMFVFKYEKNRQVIKPLCMFERFVVNIILLSINDDIVTCKSAKAHAQYHGK